LLALYPRRALARAVEVARPIGRPPFGVEWMHVYLPHYLKDPLSRLHHDLATDLAGLDSVRGQRRCYVAPRGSAKTTWLSKAYPLYAALEGREPLTLLLAETGGQAAKYLDSIKRELESNPAIARDYPGAAGKGALWQGTHIRLRNGCEIVARGAGGRILGLTAGSRRPTLVVIDDGNERGDAYSPTKRKRKLDWMVRDVLPVGEPGTNFVVAGTPIHREAIVCDMRRAGWPTKSYSALTKLPARLDLWAQCERLLHNLSDPDREQTARAFYETNRTEMDRGAELLWPERLTLFDLMSYRARYGEAAFRTEYSDDPGSAEGAEWPAEWFEDRPGMPFWFDEWPQGLTARIQSLDPSKGTSDKSHDYQAHVMLGFWPGPNNENLLFVDAELRHDPDFVTRALTIAERWSPHELIAESNSTMGLLMPEFRTQQRDRAEAGRPFPGFNVFEVYHTQPKLWRIRGLTRYLQYGQVRVRNTPGGRLLVEQMRDVPNGAFDDGPDALATAVLRLEEVLSGKAVLGRP
jgi:hypothetical protein